MLVMIRLLSAILLLNLLLWMPVKAQIPQNLSLEKSAKIEQAVTAFMSRLNVPGISIAIVTDNQLRWQQGYGLADLENFVPAKANTVYRLASVTKPITAVAVMQPVEKGQIDLDAAVQKYVPSFPQRSHPITIRELLTHTSGIRH